MHTLFAERKYSAYLSKVSVNEPVVTKEEGVVEKDCRVAENNLHGDPTASGGESAQ